MFDEKGMLTDRARGILFWITITMIAIVAVLAVLFILSQCSKLLPSNVETPLVIVPAEVTLCTGEQRQFTFEGDDRVVTWEATGGTVTQSGAYTAGTVPGDYAVTVAGEDSNQEAAAIVHIENCAPTATPIPTIPVTPTPTPEPTPEMPEDPQDDIGDYTSGAPVSGAPGGVDIKFASVMPGMRVNLQPDESAPEDLVTWAGEGSVLLWIDLHTAIPDPPAARTQWVFVLDLDGNTATGRPPGHGGVRINPDLGDEIAIVVEYTTGGLYTANCYVWNTGQGGFANGPEMRYTIDESRTRIAFAVSYEALGQAASQNSGVTIAPDAVKGRAAALGYVGQQRVIDFYPDLP